MMKTILTHKKDLLAFAVGLLAASLTTGVMQAEAAIADLNVVSHSHGCYKLATSPGGTVNVIGNGIKNTNLTTALQLACPLTSPADGFAAGSDSVGADVYDLNAATGFAATMKSCYTLRAILGTGCTAAVATDSTATFTGLTGLTTTMQASTGDALASRYVEVVLPRTNLGNSSVLRGYGYKDVSAGALQTQVDGLEAIIGDWTDNGADTIDNRLNTLEAP